MNRVSMNRVLTAIVPVALLTASFAARADDRLIDRPYASDQVVRVNGRLGVQATIGFGENEAIENVAVGDSEMWQITPNKRADLLFVKPLTASARTNMTVVTNRHTYFFDLVASPRTEPVYMLRFTYKDEPRNALVSAPAAGLPLNDAEQQVIEGDLAAAPLDPALLNFSWKRKGDADLMPARIYDDGDSTYLLWGAKQRVPAILVTNDTGEEGPVNYAVRGAAIVIADVPREILLRFGKKSATLENLRPPAPERALKLPPNATPAEPVTAAGAASARATPAAAIAAGERPQLLTQPRQ